MFGTYAIEKLMAFLDLKMTNGRPQTFNEKIRYKAAFDRRPLLVTFADKFKVRSYVGKTIGEHYLPRLYACGDNLTELNTSNLPTSFVFKVNHGSGGVVIVWEGSRSQQLLPEDATKVSWTSYEVTPSSLNVENLISLGQHWLGMDYYHYKGCNRMPEWAYKNIRRKFLVEEVLLENSTSLATDYKFHMFNGKCEVINVIRRNVFDSISGQVSTTSDIFSSTWVPLRMKFNDLASSGTSIERPEKLQEMIEVSEKLAGGIDYLRVDLYNPADKRVLVGELTNYPMAGHMKFEPPDLDMQFGQKLRLDTDQYSRFFDLRRAS